MMRIRQYLPPLLCLLAACGDERAADTQSAAAPAKQTAYAECMEAANRLPSRAETVIKAGECMRLPGAPPSGSALPADIPPPPGAEEDTASGEITSLYSPLVQEQCRVIEEDEETDYSVSRCPGIAGYALNVSDGDARVSIDVITPDGREHPLQYWTVITSAFTTLGPRAEWRMRGTRPIALIARVNANEDQVNFENVTSYLAVAKITPSEICVTDRIRPMANANEAARIAADRSADRPCLKEQPQD